MPGIESLGARTFDDFFRAPGESGFERAALVARGPGLDSVCYPLPGTPDASGRFRGRPLGVGTGSVRLRRFTHASLREIARTRFTHPRSTSVAEREWNLLCHLRAFGVGTEEPLAVGRGAGSVFAQRSFLATRELEDVRALDVCAVEEKDPQARAVIARALGLALERVFRSNTWLPELAVQTIVEIKSPHAAGAGEPCVARQIAVLKNPIARDEPPVRGLRWGRLPEIAFLDVHGGRIVFEITLAQRVHVLAALAQSAPPIESRNALRIARYALGRTLVRAARRKALRQLVHRVYAQHGA